jgi:hypothetical protein
MVAPVVMSLLVPSRSAPATEPVDMSRVTFGLGPPPSAGTIERRPSARRSLPWRHQTTVPYTSPTKVQPCTCTSPALTCAPGAGAFLDTEITWVVDDVASWPVEDVELGRCTYDGHVVVVTADVDLAHVIDPLRDGVIDVLPTTRGVGESIKYTWVPTADRTLRTADAEDGPVTCEVLEESGPYTLLITRVRTTASEPEIRRPCVVGDGGRADVVVQGP